MLSLWKAQQLGFKLRQERRSLGEENETGLEFCLMNVEPRTLVAINRDGLDRPRQDFLELLSQGDACVAVRLPLMLNCGPPHQRLLIMGYSRRSSATRRPPHRDGLRTLAVQQEALKRVI